MGTKCTQLHADHQRASQIFASCEIYDTDIFNRKNNLRTLRLIENFPMKKAYS